MKKNIFYTLILCLIPCFLLLATEEALRFYIFFKNGQPGKSYGLWRTDKVLGAQHKESAYNLMLETNDHGFKNKQAGRFN